jgi:hypothetical protein
VIAADTSAWIDYGKGLEIDHGVALIAEDRDYRHFTRMGLKLA